MFQGFFELKTAQDLLGKLKCEYAQLEKSPLDQDIAFNLFITAEHISDWLYPEKADSYKRSNLRNSSIYLQVCSHIANGSKHFKAEAKHHKSVSHTSISKGLFNPVIFAPNIFGGSLMIYLDGDAAQKLGHSISAVTLAKGVLEFWEKYMNNLPHP